MSKIFSLDSSELVLKVLQRFLTSIKVVNASLDRFGLILLMMVVHRRFIVMIGII